VILDSLGKTGTTVGLSSRFGGVDIRSCAESDGKFACSAVQNVPPGGTATFDYPFLVAIGSPAMSFSVRFFDEADDPANPTAYITLQENPPPPKNDFTWGLTGSVGSKRDPVLTTTKAELCGPFFACVEGHKNRINGAARFDFKQKILNFVEASASVQLRDGDFGTKEALFKDDPKPRDQVVTIPRFQFNVYSEIGLNLQFGRFTFAEPLNKIAISESGEGFRLLFRNIGASYIVRRESLSGLAADRENRDSTVAVLQLSNLPVSKGGPVRSISLIALRGEDKTPITTSPETEAISKTPYVYSTYGGELRYAIPLMHVNGTAGGFWSERDAAVDGIDCTLTGPVCNGKGNVWMVTATRSFAIDTKNRARRAFALSWAEGTADNPATTNRDEGYIGERSSFTPDLIFMSSFVATLNKFDRTLTEPIPATSLPPFGLGGGLSNKRYRSFKYVENAFSPLLVIVRDWLGVSDADIAGYQTILTYHDYRLRRALENERDLGREFDIEFQLESPKGVKTFIRGGYYKPGDAVKPWLEDDVWTVATGISISM